MAQATKERAHELIEQIDPQKVAALVAVLERIADPVAYSLANAPLEDELIADEENESVARARIETRPPSAASHEEFLAEFGLTMDDWEELGNKPLKTMAKAS